MDYGSLMPGHTYLKPGLIKKKLGDIGQTAFASIQQDPSFPKPFRLSPGVLVWDVAEIDSYVESRRQGETDTQEAK
jgi:predicted DNA-binding transcriptional regulator AlpA